MVETGTSYFGVRNVSHVENDLVRFREDGLNAVLHTFSERDREYYAGTMKEIVAASHQHGFTVYVNPWAVGRVFGGEAFSEFIGQNPDACQVLSTGERVPAACFNQPEFRAYMRDWIRDAVEIGADILFWDEPHWYIPEWFDRDVEDDAWSCRCDACREAYEERYDEPMPNAPTDRTVEFREASLLDFLEEMMSLTREYGAENAVCLLPREDAEYGLSNWARLAESNALDVLATDPYWDAFDHADSCEAFVSKFTDTVVSLADEHDIDSQIWIQGFRLDGDPETIEDVRTATRIAVDGGVDSVFMWGYDACESISSIACDDPDAVWSAYVDALSETA